MVLKGVPSLDRLLYFSGRSGEDGVGKEVGTVLPKSLHFFPLSLPDGGVGHMTRALATTAGSREDSK